jgi:hypothetical protein
MIGLADAHLEYFWYVLESCLCSHFGWFDKTNASGTTGRVQCSEKTDLYSIVYIIICAVPVPPASCRAAAYAEFSSLVELLYRILGDQPSLTFS